MLAPARPRRALFWALALLLSTSMARGGSTSGTEFWTCWMESFDRTNDFGLAVANDGLSPATVTVSSPTRQLASAVIAPGAVNVFRFDPADRNAPLMLVGTRKAMASYRINSDVPVTVYQFNTLLKSAVTRNHTHDGVTVLPVTALGPRYRISSWPQVEFTGQPGRGLLAVVAFAALPTTVTITPTAPTLAGDIGASPAGTPIVVTLQRGEVLQLASDLLGSDLTGTVVTADRPIAVFGGSVCSQVPAGTRFCDHLEEQYFPTQAWGKEFLAVKSKARGTIPDYWRVLAQRDGTSVTLAPDPIGGGPHALAAGEFLQFSSVSDVVVQGSLPLQVTQYFAGSTYSGLNTGPGDPSLILTVPTEQFETDFLFYVPDLFSDDNVILVKPAGATFLLDGMQIPQASFAAIGSSGFEKAIVPVADGVHSAIASEPSMVYVFGFERDTSYGYYAGGRPEPIGSAITCDITATTPGPCDGGWITLDATGSLGTPPLRYTWTPVTPGLVISSPTAGVTRAQLPAGSSSVVGVTISNNEDAVTCWVQLAPPPDPAPPPVVTCLARITVEATQAGGEVVVVTATASASCPPVDLVNNRTSGGGDATDFYPCGTTNVRFTATDAIGQSTTCTTRVEVGQSWIPAEVSGLPFGVPLRVSKLAGNAELRLTFADLDQPLLRYNAYAGTVPATLMSGYDHAPIACSFAPASIAPGVQERRIPFVPGINRYFLVSASNCGDEGTRGYRSDRLERPARPSDCGLAR